MESDLRFCDKKYSEEVKTAKQEITGFSFFILQKKTTEKEAKLSFMPAIFLPCKE